MKAMVLHQLASIDSSPLALEDLPEPQPTAGEVRLHVHCCAICRTDLHVIEGELPQHTLPIIPGHQIVGTIDALGPDCTHLQIGQRVGVAWLRATCGRCRYCATDRENLCQSPGFTGYHADGGYATSAVVPEDFAYPIPDSFSDNHAAPLLCAGIIGYRALQRCNLPNGSRLALYGFGSSAHVVLRIARHRGAEVYVVSRTPEHQQLARDLGAAWAGSDATQMPHKADSAISFAPVGNLVPTALEHLTPGGTLALAGIYMSDVPPLNYEQHLFHERDLRSVTANTRADARALLAEAAEIPIRPHVTTYPLTDANRALQDLKHDRLSGTGVLIVS